MNLRDATEEDLPVLNAIYNEVLLRTSHIYRTRPWALEDRVAWFATQQAGNFPTVVAQNEDLSLAGFGSFGSFRAGDGYSRTVEISIHLRPGARRQGTGTRILQRLIEIARQQGRHVLMAAVDAGNEPSLRFLEKAGFTQAGTLPQVGYKFGRYLDLVLLHYTLD